MTTSRRRSFDKLRMTDLRKKILAVDCRPPTADR